MYSCPAVPLLLGGEQLNARGNLKIAHLEGGESIRIRSLRISLWDPLHATHENGLNE